MGLPELIEIVGPSEPLRAEVTVPGSKSMTNRALVLAALAGRETTLEGALWSEDTEIMVEGLRRLGFDVTVAAEPCEACNRTITVVGQGGQIPNAGTAQHPLEVFVGNAGTAARFLSALVCLGKGVYRLHGTTRMHERPQAALFAALRELGYRVESPIGKLPALIYGEGPRSGFCTVSIEESSQFASALLLCADIGGWRVRIIGENAEESPYVNMTRLLVEAFPDSGGRYQIEPDASSGSYFWAAAEAIRCATGTEGSAVVPHWPASGLQADEKFPALINQVSSGARTAISRGTDLGDSIMTAIVLAPFWNLPTTFTDLGRLRLQECERVTALRTELTKCGARVVEDGDTLTVFPSRLHGAEVETYNDHRMAMCFAVVGLVVPAIRLRNPSCVKKTFPDFFQKLAAAPPAGLGATIREVGSGRLLGGQELFAG